MVSTDALRQEARKLQEPCGIDLESLSPEEVKRLFCELQAHAAEREIESEELRNCRQAEEKLRKSEERYRDLAVSIDEVFFVLDRDLKYTYWNKAAERLTGISAEGALGKSVYDIFPDTADTSSMVEIYKEVIDTGKPQAFEREYHFKDRTYYFEITAYPSSDGISTFAKDISERIWMGEELRLQARHLGALVALQKLAHSSEEEILRAVQEASLELLQSECSFLGFLDESGSMLTVHQWSRTVTVQCALADNPLFPPIALAGLWGECVRLRKPVLINDHAMPNRYMDGFPEGHATIRRFLSVPVFDKEHVIAVAAVANKSEDYTELDICRFTAILDKMWELILSRRAEQQLSESENRYRGLFESSRDAIMIIEPPSWGFTAGNQATLDMFKAENEREFLYSEPWRLSPDRQPDGRLSSEKAGEMIEKAMREGSCFFEWTHRRLNGDEFFATVLLSRVEQGEGAYLQAMVRDITDRRQMEDALKEHREHLEELVTERTAALEFANRSLQREMEDRSRAEKKLREAHEMLVQSEKRAMIGEMASGVAHELNQPLNHISLTAQIMEKTSKKRTVPPHELLQHISIIQENIIRASGVIRCLREFSCREMGDLRAIDTGESIRNAVTMFRSRLTQNDILFTTDMPGHPVMAMASVNRLSQVMVNLLANACEALAECPAEQKKNIHVRVREHDDTVTIDVEDNGSGIKEEVLPHIFTPFYTTKDLHKGAGIGLYISQGILEQFGGRLEGASRKDQGTIMTITLKMPAAMPAVSQQASHVVKDEGNPCGEAHGGRLQGG